MATYRELQGFNIEVLSTDPSNPIQGQIWYNTTAGKLKLAEPGSWSSQASTTRAGIGTAAAGTTSAAFILGARVSGPGSPPIAPQAYTEEFDGSAWTNSNDQLHATNHCGGGIGTQTAGLICGGYSPSPTKSTYTQLYDGTSWSEGSTMITAVVGQFNSIAGTQTACYTVGGPSSAPGGGVKATQELNGTTWSATNPMSRPSAPTRQGGGGAGTQTAGLGGGGSGAQNLSETYDGNSWAAAPTLSTPYQSCTGSGTQTAAMIAGGYTSGYPTVVNAFNGASWSAIDSMSQGREHAGSCGAGGTMLIAGGSKGVTDVVNFACEAYSDPTLKNVTTEAGRP